MRIYLVRHGESAANAEGRAQGHIDSPLSERGRREAARVAGRLAALEIGAVYASTLSRALDTAAAIGERLGLTPVPREELRERDIGVLEGLTRHEMRERFPDFLRALAEGDEGAYVPGWERAGPFARRVTAAFDELIERHPGASVAVVTHGGVITQFCRQVLGLGNGWTGMLALGNTSVTTVEARDGSGDAFGVPRLQLLTLNDVCHLDGLAAEG